MKENEETSEPVSELPGTKAAAEPIEPAVPQPRPDELPAVLEALLFATTKPLNVKQLSMLTGGLSSEEIGAALEQLRIRFGADSSGLMVMEVAGGYQLATKASVADWVLALHKHRRKNPISPAVMETLAIVAYKQPIVRAEVESIRGVDCGGVLRALQDGGLVEVVGQKEVAGRPSLYGTSQTFLKTFGLRDLKELPSLADLQQILTTQMKGREDEPEDAGQGEEENRTDATDRTDEP